VNRTQALILGFSLVAWIALVAILFAAPEIYDAQLKPLGLAGWRKRGSAFWPRSRPCSPC
jgi:hypothetical protein